MRQWFGDGPLNGGDDKQHDDVMVRMRRALDDDDDMQDALCSMALSEVVTSDTGFDDSRIPIVEPQWDPRRWDRRGRSFSWAPDTRMRLRYIALDEVFFGELRRCAGSSVRVLFVDCFLYFSVSPRFFICSGGRPPRARALSCVWRRQGGGRWAHYSTRDVESVGATNNVCASRGGKCSNRQNTWGTKASQRSGRASVRNHSETKPAQFLWMQVVVFRIGPGSVDNIEVKRNLRAFVSQIWP